MDRIDIVFEDEHLLGVAKPSGLAVHRGWSAEDDVLVARVRAHFGTRKAYPIHRLDRGASGAVLFAKNSEIAAALNALFDAGGVEKRYIVVVRGVAPEEGLIDHAIPRKEGGPRVDSRTRFRRIWSGAAQPRWLSVVECWPETGRLHQIRRHLKHINHPVIGDSNYGKGKLNRAIRDTYGLDRLALHAAELAFIHPVTSESVSIAAPLPPDLAEPLERIGWIPA